MDPTNWVYGKILCLHRNYGSHPVMLKLANISNQQDKHVDLPPTAGETSTLPEIILQIINKSLKGLMINENITYWWNLTSTNELTSFLNMTEFIRKSSCKTYLTSFFMMETHYYNVKNWPTTFTDNFSVICHLCYSWIWFCILIWHI